MASPPIPPEIGALYRGHVMHMRLRPRGHRFRYRLWTMLLDLDRKAEVARRLRLFSLDRFNLIAHHDRDHGPRDGSPLRPWVEARLAEAGLPRPARIRLLAMPRTLGWVFNPLSVYFCEDAAGRLESVVYEVKNTFGEQIAYAQPAEPEADGAIRHRQDKRMFVSPFIDMDQVYRFDLRPPDARLSLRIRQGPRADQDHAGRDVLIATQSGTRRALCDRRILGLSLAMPLTPVVVIVAIHWQALRLWMKGAPFRRYPGPTPAISAAPRDPQPDPGPSA